RSPTLGLHRPWVLARASADIRDGRPLPQAGMGAHGGRHDLHPRRCCPHRARRAAQRVEAGHGSSGIEGRSLNGMIIVLKPFEILTALLQSFVEQLRGLAPQSVAAAPDHYRFHPEIQRVSENLLSIAGWPDDPIAQWVTMAARRAVSEGAKTGRADDQTLARNTTPYLLAQSQALRSSGIRNPPKHERRPRVCGDPRPVDSRFRGNDVTFAVFKTQKSTE